MLDRPRHEEEVKEIREAGARIRFIPHGDVSASLLAVTQGSPVDLLWGIGGTPEGVISASRDQVHRRQDHRPALAAQRRGAPGALDAGYDLDEVLDTDRLVSGENVFFSATGVTDGDMLEGVHFQGPRAPPPSRSSMRSRSGTVRRITARHDRAKLREITGERVG